MDYFKKWHKETIKFLGGKCATCGSPDDLEIDHIDESSKSFNVSKNWGMKDKVALAQEIGKCQALCAMCHSDKTIRYLESVPDSFVHGTLYSFMKKKCRCDICEAKKREWYDMRNAQRRANPNNPYNLDKPHGTRICYSRGCRCDECRAANARNEMERKARKKAV